MPREKLTPERRRQLTLDAMLDAAETVFAKKGFGGASMEEIAAEAGYSRAALYAKFGNKEDLLAAVLDRHSSRQSSAFSSLTPPATPVEGALDAAEIFRGTTDLGLIPLEMELRLNAFRNPDVRRRVLDADRKQGDKMAELIEHNMQAGNHRLDIPARDLADIGRAAVLGLMQYAALDEEEADRYQQLVETVFVLLAEPAARPKPAIAGAQGNRRQKGSRRNGSPAGL
ncbi:MAG TPA: helix-turn-helix domain-containing protein [Acidimicrobiales bacterium]|nr:helix-turn-helix domain-containing protein [Acidimicrobiales bacterium]